MKKILLFLITTLFVTWNINEAQTIDDFNYAGNLNANGWSVHSGAGSNVIATTTGLSYAGYINSGIGNAALINNLGGEDVNYTPGIGPYNTNGATVYLSFMVKVTEGGNKTGDYFFNLGNRTSVTSFSSFCSRIFAKVNAGAVNFGISNSSTASYGTTNFSTNTTYVIVVKYTINTAGNDQADLWVYTAGIPNTEATAGAKEYSSTTTAGQDIINAIALRQGSTTQPQTVVDGLRIATSWFSLITSPPVATAATNVASTSFSANWNAVTGASGYYLDVATDAGFTSFVTGYNNLDVGNVTTKSVTGLTGGVTYYYRVRAYNGSESGLNSNTKTNVDIVLDGMEGGTIGYTESDPATQITALTTVTANIANLDNATVQITSNYQSGADVLSFTNANGITGSWNAATGTLTLTGTTTVANYQTALRSITYQNTSQNPSVLQRTISFTTTGSLINSNAVTRNISVTAVNNAPTLAGIELADLSFSPGQAAKLITTSITLNDPDNANMSSATVIITANNSNTEDVLSFTNQSGITGTWTAGTGTLNLNGVATVANYQSALRSVKYENISQSPSLLPRTISFTANDGTTNSNTVTRKINIVIPPKRPVITALETTPLSYPGGSATVAITQTLLVSDADNTTLVSAVIQISGNFQSGYDVLNFTNANGITGTWNASSGVLRLTGESSVSNYQAALRSVTYQHLDGGISNLYVRRISFQVNDGTSDSYLVSREINFAVTPPVLSGMESTPLEYRQGDSTKIITTSINITDNGIPNLKYAIIRISNNYRINEDVLGFTTESGFIGTWNPTQGILLLNVNSSVSNYEAALRSVTYYNTSNSPSTQPRTISFIVADMYSESNQVSRIINITPVFTVSLITAPTNGGTTSGGGAYDSGKSVTVTAVPNAGYKLVSWTEGGVIVSTDLSYTFLLSSNRTLTANFEAVLYTISASPIPTEGGTTTGGGTFYYGNSVTVKALPNSGYDFANWTENSSIVSDSLNYTFLVNSNRNLVANFTTARILSVTPEIINATSSKGTASILVYNSGGGNMKWNAVSNVFWITITTEASGTNNGEIKISYSPNNSISRIGTITISADGVIGSPKIVEVRQAGILTSVNDLNIGIPKNYQVEQNYPNPFNPSTVIRYGLPTESDVTVTVYNILGEEVVKLFDGIQSAGFHEINFNATGLSSGIYIYKISAGNSLSDSERGFTQIKKMLLMK